MQKCCLATLLAAFVCLFVQAQTDKKKMRYRVGATISPILVNIANNEVGIGGFLGAEKSFSKSFAAEVEVSYSYFAGDQAMYTEGSNKAWAVPVLAGVKAFVTQNLYGSLRTGAIFFMLNDQTTTHIQPALGLAGGMNFPQKNNRLNIQLGYTGFRFNSSNRGYATLAAAFIIN